MMKQKGKKAFSPVLATLMMVAVAVAMSVIIFTWSQSFLSQTSEAAAGQQASQNVAAQSGIAIEAVTAQASTTTANGTATIYIRNVGAASVKLGSIGVLGRSGNAGFKAAIVNGSLAPNTSYYYYATGKRFEITTPSSLTLPKGDATSVTVNFAKKGTTTDTDDDNYELRSGDVLTVKVTTTAGTFAQATYTVP
jgi:flagellin-like protein